MTTTDPLLLAEPTIAATDGRAVLFTTGLFADLTRVELPGWFEAVEIKEWPFPDGSIANGIRVVCVREPERGVSLKYTVTRSEFDRVLAWMCGIEQKRAAGRKRARR